MFSEAFKMSETEVKSPVKDNCDLVNNTSTRSVSECEDVKSPDVEEDRPHSPQFDPIVSLPEIQVTPLEEDEDVMFVMRAKLFRYDNEADPPEWKERGTGDMKILKHKSKPDVARVLMRRDKTLKVCTNHQIMPWMKLQPHGNSERTWMWSVNADYVDDEISSQVLAARFATPENAKKFKDVFNECQPTDDKFDASLDGELNNSVKDRKDDESEELEKKLEKVSLESKEEKE